MIKIVKKKKKRKINKNVKKNKKLEKKGKEEGVKSIGLKLKFSKKIINNKKNTPFIYIKENETLLKNIILEST